MADKRGKDLTELLASQIQALLNTLSIPVDDPSFSEARRLVLSSLLNSNIVDANTNNYQALTPKGFYDSIATESRKGVQRLATSAEVTAKSGAGLLESVDQSTMQTQWAKDWFEKEAVPNHIEADSFTSPNAMNFRVNFVRTLNSGNSVSISPVLPANHRYAVVHFTYALESDIIELVPGVGTGYLLYNGTIQSFTLLAFSGGVDFSIELNAVGTELTLKAGIGTGAKWRVSMSFNCVIEQF